MRHRLLVISLAVAGLLLAACGSDAIDDPGRTAAEPAPAVTPTPEVTPTVPPLHPSVDAYPETVVTLTGPDGDVERIAVKVADTADRRRHGLMEVEDLPDGTGMLFAYGEDRTGAFWMKDTLVPLSIAFIASDGEILEILPMEPCEEEPCELYDPGVAYRYALEVPQGWFEQVGIDRSWRVEGRLPEAAGS